MAGGVGGAGGSPNGVTGGTGTTQPQETYDTVDGGPGGDNGQRLIDGSEIFGPYGQGGQGSSTNGDTTENGKPGAVVIVWGGGLSGSATFG